MKPKARFIKSVIEAARENRSELPWTRGHARASLASGRRTAAPQLRTKTA